MRRVVGHPGIGQRVQDEVAQAGPRPRVTRGRSTRLGLPADGRMGTRPVFNHHPCFEPLRYSGRDMPHHDVVGTTGRETGNDAHGFTRAVLLAGAARHCGEHSGCDALPE